MNYIRIGNHFINVRKAEHIQVMQSRSSLVTIEITYPDTVKDIHLPTNADQISTSPVLTPKMISNAIEIAISNLCDADCEDVGEYVEEEDEDNTDY